MEYLTKSQIILLTLFVSFVSSMATGIVVVTLMQQAPEPVFQTITKVVEKTIEKVVPTIIEKPGKQVVVKDEDLLVAAIDRNMKGVIALKVAGEEGGGRSVGIGVIVSSDGVVVTERKNVAAGALVATVDSARYRLEVSPPGDRGDHSGLLVSGKLVPADLSATSTPSAVFSPVALAVRSGLKVGQTAVVIGGRDGKTIINGLITNLDERTVVNPETKRETKVLANIGLSQRLSGVSNGAPIISLDGTVIGFVSIDETTESQVGVPALEVKELLGAIFPHAPGLTTEPLQNNLSAEAKNALP